MKKEEEKFIQICLDFFWRIKLILQKDIGKRREREIQICVDVFGGCKFDK